jgi:hypothetical protein
MKAKIKYTKLETIIQISLKFFDNQNKLPLIHSGDKNNVAKYVHIANITHIHWIQIFIASINHSLVKNHHHSANVTSEVKNETTKNKEI